MANIQTASFILPQVVKNEFLEFYDWHQNLKNSLNRMNLQGNEEVEYLNKILLVNKVYFYDKIDRLAELCLSFSLDQKKILFQYISESGLHDDLKGVPYFYHGIFKPRGYAGDADMMALVYRNKYEGISTFSKLLHKIGTECEACIAIRNRKNLLKKAFGELKNGNVLSLAAGPAQEIYEYLSTTNGIDFLALDHDIKTLRNANRNITGLEYGIINAFHLIKGSHKYLIPKEKKY